jgi:ketopantoate reductase
MFAGKLMELADQHGLSVPVNRTLYRLIRAKEYMYLKK